MWQDIATAFARDFYIDCQSLIKSVPDTPEEYLKRLKIYSSKTSEHEERWTNLAQLLELINLSNDIEYLREWYKKVMKIDEYVNQYIQYLSKVSSLKNTRTTNIHLYDFIDDLIPTLKSFMETMEPLLNQIKEDFFNTLERSQIELRLLDRLYQKFNDTFKDFDIVKISFYKVETEGATKDFDSIYHNMLNQTQNVSNLLEQLKTDFDMFFTNKALNSHICTLIQLINEITEHPLIDFKTKDI
ncbi:hypothetical protein JOC36_000942 [Weissella uvarum]|uniref:hypothetical protein n=1 Tax=Weissella uvarum TaxID=1479233 RepID=UPI0019603ED3|nr:hypothetical protein [Weissella uvarum]MBM7617385.1 hypothetical protein [Weissella uvarum]MCM0595730.1 hypothetical protein [Weissella uvarum]